MAVEEEKGLPSNQWGLKFTGDDIPKSRGMLTPYANEKYREAFHRDEGKFVKISDPHGRETAVRQDQLDEALAAGYGRSPVSPRMTMPAVPWKRRKVSPGRHKFRYDKASGSIVEV